MSGGIAFTEDQRLAIETRGCDLLVSAAAGSGKTAVLAERIVRLVSEGEHPCDIDRILVVTFTRAAAAGMRERIARALSDRIQRRPGDAHLRRQEALLPHAKIMTIDAFCQYLLRNNFEAVGLDPSFRVSDEGELKLLQAEVLEELLEEEYAAAEKDPSSPFCFCADCFSRGASDRALEEEILRVHRFAESMPWPALWLEGQLAEEVPAEDERERFAGLSWVRELTRGIQKELAGGAEELEVAREAAAEPGGPWMYEELLGEEVVHLRRLSEARDFWELHGLLYQSKGGFGRLPGKRDPAVDPEKREAVRERRDAVKKSVQKNIERYFSAAPEELLAREREAGRLTRELARLALRFRTLLEERKRRKNLIDFSDMEHLALRILAREPETADAPPSPTPVALEYASYFQEIMVDEYQDSNRVQELILSAISRGGAAVPPRDLRSPGAAGNGAEDAAPGMTVQPMAEPLCRDRVSVQSRDLPSPQVACESTQDAARGALESADRGDPGMTVQPMAEPLLRDRFMVGDVKQSIYRFRLARPEIFMEKLGRSAEAGTDAPERRVLLRRNFRSRRQVIDLVNDVFAQIMHQDVGGVEYDEDAMLRLGAEHPEPGAGEDPFVPELLLFVRDAEGQEGPEETGEEAPEDTEGEAPEEEPEAASLSAEQAEARMVADRIRALMETGQVSDGAGGFRRICYRDIVILLRTTAAVDEIYRQVLTDAGIPVHIDSRDGYFRAREIRALTDLLAVLENPLRDISLAGVLRSDLGGFGDEELARVRAADPRRGTVLYEALSYYAGDNKISSDIYSEELAKKCRGFLRRLAAWRESAQRLGLRDLLDQILEETGYLEIVSALPAGAKRCANVRLFLLRAADFERSGGHGLASFAARIDQYRRAEVDYGEAGVLSEEDDLVRVMSIHKSKGLEFPVVIVAGLARGFNLADERASVLADEGVGLGAFAVDLDQRVRRTSLRRLAIADKRHLESLGEEYRVLYVAMTRAREKLILSASVTDREASRLEQALERSAEAPNGAGGRLPFLKRAHARSFFDILAAALPGCRAPFCLRRVDPSGAKEAARAERQTEEARREVFLEALEGKNIDRYLKEGILRDLSYVYAHRDRQELYVKTTVTELKERLLAEEGERVGGRALYPVPIPAARAAGGGLAGAERGTAYHKVMELLDAEVLGREGESAGLVDGPAQALAPGLERWMRAKERLPGGYAEAVDAGDVAAFLRSPLGQRFVRAFRRGALNREKQFMMSIDARRAEPSAPEGETVLLQGVIDACFEEEDGIVLLDYKTDQVRGDGEELAQKYGVQLALYAEALERLTDRRVKERWIWSFALGRALILQA